MAIPLRVLPTALGLIALSALPDTVPAQGTAPPGPGPQANRASAVGWGDAVFDTRWAGQGGFVQVAVGFDHTVALRADGSAVAWGRNEWGQCELPPLPAGVTYTRVAAATRNTFAVRSDGVLVRSDAARPVSDPTPPLPPGVRYIDVQADNLRFTVLRSDGRIVVVPKMPDPFNVHIQVPPLPGGAAYTAFSQSAFHTAALRSDGVIVTWGTGTGAQQGPIQPNFSNPFIKVVATWDTTLWLQSDGTVWGIGSNHRGHLDVPALPTGVRYTDLATNGAAILATRSDGTVVAWGSDTRGVVQEAPSAPGGFVAVFAGPGAGYALDGNGQLTRWGGFDGFRRDHGGSAVHLPSPGLSAVQWLGRTMIGLDANGQLASLGLLESNLQIPPAPPGLRYKDLALHGFYGAAPLATIGLRSDGQVIEVLSGQPGAPWFPPPAPNRRYTRLFSSPDLCVALQDDGLPVPFAATSSGLLPLPALPPGRHVVDMALSRSHGLMLLDDGSIQAWGSNMQGQLNVPPSQGLPYTQVAVGRHLSVALRADGSLAVWGDCSFLGCLPPQTPPTLPFVRVACGDQHIAAIRADGQLLVWGADRTFSLGPPALPVGLGYVDVDCSASGVIGYRGAPASYTLSHWSCRPPPESLVLTAQDLPLLGQRFRVLLNGLPLNLGLVLTGPADLTNPAWTNPALHDPGNGLPCWLHVTTPYLVTPVIGSGDRAFATWQIPNDPRLLGMGFRQQAVVPQRDFLGRILTPLSEAWLGVIGGG